MRDDHVDWELHAQAAPYHNVLTTGYYAPELLNQERIDHFFNEGEIDIDKALRVIREKIAPDFAPRSVVDFGCGVGRLSLALGAQVETVYGVDASPTMLAEADRQRIARRPGADIRFSQDIPDAGTDWIFSMLVFQHIRPQLGMVILKTLLRRLNAGGVFSVQLPAYRNPEHFYHHLADADFIKFDGDRLEILQSTPAPVPRMNMFDYDINHVLAALVSAGITETWFRHLDGGGHSSFWMYGRKGAD